MSVETPVTGTVWKVNFQVGDQVSAGDVIIIMEAMKMEIPVESPMDGFLYELFVAEGDQVSEDEEVATVSNASPNWNFPH
tara:strand:- start:603 stop:842 length:240 start_codon:yes stop_codon:yes gene_type:complete